MSRFANSSRKTTDSQYEDGYGQTGKPKHVNRKKEKRIDAALRSRNVDALIELNDEDEDEDFNMFDFLGDDEEE